MVTIRTSDTDTGRIIFQVDNNSSDEFSAAISLAIEVLSNRDILELIQRARDIAPYTHRIIRVEHGLLMERFIARLNPFVTMFRTTSVNNHITVVYTILQNHV